MIRELRIFSVLLLLSVPVWAELDTTRTWTYGGHSSDGGRHILSASDRGFLITGYSYSAGAGKSDVYLVKTDSSGHLEWEAFLGGPSQDYGNEAVEMTDGGFAVAGWTASTENGDRDVYLAKVNDQGALEWEHTYGGPAADEGYSICDAGDGLVISGRTESFGAGEGDIYLVKTDYSGQIIWTKVYGESLPEWGNCVRQTADGDLVIAGTKGTSDRNMEVSLLKTDSSGEMIWWTLCGDTDFDWGEEVVVADDGNLYVVGHVSVIYEDLMQGFVLKFASHGSVQWTRKIGQGTYYDYACSAAFTPEHGLVVLGVTKNSPTTFNRFSLFKVNPWGAMKDFQVWERQGSDWAESLCVGQNGELFAAGQTDVRGSGPYDVYVMGLCEPTGLMDSPPVLDEFGLMSCAPNPFNPETRIQFALARPGRVELKVYDIMGREMWQHVEPNAPAGWHTRRFSGEALPAGVYFCRLVSGGQNQVIKMVLMK